jgi:hypothetical protein
MHYLMPLGPVSAGKDVVWMVFGASETEPPVVGAAPSIAQAFADLQPQLAGRPFVCAPELVDALGQPRLPSAEPPEGALKMCAAFALQMAHGPQLGPENFPNLCHLLELAVELADAAPWELWHSGQVIELRAKGSVTGTWDLVILGNAGQNFGVGLHPRGAVAKLLARDEEDPAPPSQLLALDLDDSPEFAARAMEAAVGLDAVPMITRLKRGKPARPSRAELLLLEAAVAAACRLEPEERVVHAVAALEGERVEVTLRAPPPEGDEPDWAEDEDFVGDLDAPGLPPLRAVPLQAPPRPERNEPCHCGSGRKYKQCHLGADQVSTQALAPIAIPAASARLDLEVSKHLRKRFGTARLKSALEKAGAGEAGSDAEAMLAFQLAFHHFPLEGKTGIEWLLEEKGRKLAGPDRQWLETQAAARLSVWKVLAARPGEALEVMDPFTGDRVEIAERTASRTLQAGDYWLGRIVHWSGAWIVHAAPTTALRPFEGASLVEALRARFEALGHCGPFWMELAAAYRQLSRQQAQAPMLQTPEGEPILITTERFTFEPAARDELLRKLARHKEVAREPSADSDEGPERFTVYRGRKRDEDGLRPILGSVEVGPAELKLESLTVERVDALREKVLGLGVPLRFVARSHVDPTSPAVRGALRPKNREEDAALQEAAAPILLGFKEKHYATWPDVPLPALDGQTPREAVEGGRGRARVAALLEELERGEATVPPAQRFDVGRLRKDLGL